MQRKSFFLYAGFYCVYRDEYTIKYAPVHLEDQKTFVSEIEINDHMIEWGNLLVFDLMSETVSMWSYCDKQIMELIVARMQELSFQ